MPEPPAIALGFVQFFDNIELGNMYLLNDHLGNPISAVKNVRGGA